MPRINRIVPAIEPAPPLGWAAAWIVAGFRDSFGEFRAALRGARCSDDAECVHRARVAWRRCRAALQFYRPLLGRDSAAPLAALAMLGATLSALRDLDVARLETLPPLAARAARRQPDGGAHPWLRAIERLGAAAATARLGLRALLEQAATEQALNGLFEHVLTSAGHVPADLDLACWARRRLARLDRTMCAARAAARDAADWHRVRILAKRLRYDAEALTDLLPDRLLRRRQAAARTLQERIGATRDLLRAAELVIGLPDGPELAAALRRRARRSGHGSGSPRGLRGLRGLRGGGGRGG